MSAFDAGTWHRERAEQCAHRLDAVRVRSRRLGWLRLASFSLAASALIWALSAPPGSRAVPFCLGLLLGTAFVALVVRHNRERAVRRALEHRLAYHEQGERRAARDWGSLPTPATPPIPPEHPYAHDLAIVGRASLLQLLDVTSPAPGRTTLLDWMLSSTAPPDEIAARQAAVRELAAHDALRIELGTLARSVGHVSPAIVSRFVAWCEKPPWLLERPALVWAVRVITLVTVSSLVLAVAGLLPHAVWLLAATAGFSLTLSVRHRAGTLLDLPDIELGTLHAHREMLGRIAAAEFRAPRLVELGARATAHGGAERQLRAAERMVAWGEARRSPMLHAALQWLLAWDVHVAAALERWRRDAGAFARDWLMALGEVEALAALATLAHEHPSWTFPALSGDGTRALEAAALGHPLLPDATRVANDVRIGPRGTFLLITGSNMSGKSTLLRAVGANVVLAQAGGPVCAASFHAPVVALHASLRVEDSLEEGVSRFMAELLRLRAIVGAARSAPPSRPVLYVLDEILHATNAAERRIAAASVIGHLLDAGAIGVVTTHDLALASEPGLAGSAATAHFSERFERSGASTIIRFDYRLRPGLATSSNALALLDLMGLRRGAVQPSDRRQPDA